LRDYDLEMAFKALEDNCSAPFEGGNNFRRGHDEYARLGYIPEDRKAELGVWGTVSTAMEYSLADFAASKMFAKTGNDRYAQKLLDRSKAVLKLYDEESCFFRPKLADKSWMVPYDVVSTAGEVVGHDHLGSPGYVEGNAWQYLFFLRHFPDELKNGMGGKDTLIKRLDECFEKDMFVLWNEPDMHYPFFYSSIEGEEWKTQREVTKAINKHFGTGPNGLPGNDDAGTISAWLVFAMMGIYPDAQGLTDYLVFRPVFDKVTVYLENNEKLIIINNPHAEDDYIKKVLFNGKKLEGFKIDHNLISKGGTIELEY
jgi:predicted alpha-1,2-mannosidase